LGAGRAAGADDSHNTSAFGVTYDEETTSLRKSKREEAALALGMIGVVEGDGQRITEDGGRLLERDFVVTQIRGGLLRIPRELPTLILRGRLFRTSNECVERPTTLPLAACRASQQFAGNQGAAHDSPRSARTRC